MKEKVCYFFVELIDGIQHGADGSVHRIVFHAAATRKNVLAITFPMRLGGLVEGIRLDLDS